MKSSRDEHEKQKSQGASSSPLVGSGPGNILGKKEPPKVQSATSSSLSSSSKPGAVAMPGGSNSSSQTKINSSSSSNNSNALRMAPGNEQEPNASLQGVATVMEPRLVSAGGATKKSKARAHNDNKASQPGAGAVAMSSSSSSAKGGANPKTSELRRAISRVDVMEPSTELSQQEDIISTISPGAVARKPSASSHSSSPDDTKRMAAEQQKQKQGSRKERRQNREQQELPGQEVQNGDVAVDTISISTNQKKESNNDADTNTGAENPCAVHRQDRKAHGKFQRKKVLEQTKDNSSRRVFTVEAMLVEEGGVTQEARERIKKELRDELLEQTVIGQATKVVAIEEEDDEAKKNKSIQSNGDENNSGNRKLWICLVILILLIGATVVGIVVGTQNDEPGTSASQDAVNKGPPTPSPTGTVQPSLAPSTSPSSQPSSTPTVDIANLDNGDIEQAHPLRLGAAALQNTILNAPEQTVVVDCGAQSIFFTYGLWYTYQQSKVAGPVTAVICGDGSIDVYTRTSGISCIMNKYFKDDLGDGCQGISWEAELDVPYYLLVEGFFFLELPPEFETIVPSVVFIQDEDLPVTETNLPMEEVVLETEDEVDNLELGSFFIQLVDNQQCDYAFGPVTPTSVGVVMSYTTENAQAVQGVASCGGASASTTPGVWYLVQGTGRPITATTCSENTSFDTQISVFRGDCVNLACVNGNNDFCGTQSSVVWASSESEIYYVYVHGATSDSKGSFELRISTDAERKVNDFCETAQEIVEDIKFSFSGSNADPDLPICSGEDRQLQGGTTDFPYGLWYSVIGTGQFLTATVSSNSVSPVKMNIYSGSCGGLGCAEIVQEGINCVGSGVFLQCSIDICFETTVGEEYIIFVATQALEGIDDEHSLTIANCTFF